MPQCQICTTEFSIAPQDTELLTKLDLPDPVLCSEHALQLRTSFRNERHLYKRTCGMCGKNMLTMYGPTSYIQTVYCHDCWYRDTWDALSYGRDYDSSKNFFEQWRELMSVVPHFNLWLLGTNENCEYSNIAWNSKDCYLSFSCLKSEGAIYCKNVDGCKDCSDGYYITKSELLYDCVDTDNAYKSAFLTRCHNVSECHLSRDLTDCQNCFGCVNLKHKQYYWYNEQLTKEEYSRRLTEVLKNRETFEQEKKRFADFEKTQPVEFATIRNSQDAVGDEIYNSSEIRNGFGISAVQNAGDCYRLSVVNPCHDVYRVSNASGIDNSYEFAAGGTGTTNIIASTKCAWITFSEYCYSCESSDYLFGCVGLRKKKYCILNKQYSEKEYHVLRKQIIEDMKQRGEWGQFFPPSCSPHPYNDSSIHELMPLTKEEALSRGWTWEDNQGGLRGKKTLKPENIPLSIAETNPGIMKEILACSSCGLNYRIQPKEFDILKATGMAVPLLCQECRFKNRFDKHHFPRLYDRHCMCFVAGHSKHTDKQSCSQLLKTVYAEDSGYTIFCKECYEEEIGN